MSNLLTNIKNILELGINDESINKWREMAEVKVYGLGKQASKLENIQIFAGNQSVRYDLKYLKNQIGEKLDLIIDNASKIDGHSLTAFIVLFKTLNSNGIYLINNTHYMPHTVEVFKKIYSQQIPETYWWTENEKKHVLKYIKTCEIHQKYILIKNSIPTCLSI